MRIYPPTAASMMARAYCTDRGSALALNPITASRLRPTGPAVSPDEPRAAPITAQPSLVNGNVAG
jgi:hypothetical protein